MVTEFSDAVRAQEIGVHSSAPVQSQFGYHIVRAEYFLYLEVSVLLLSHFGSFQVGKAVAVWAAAGEHESACKNNRKYGRQNPTHLNGKVAQKAHIGQKLFVAGLVYGRAEKHQKSRHKCKHSKEA